MTVHDVIAERVEKRGISIAELSRRVDMSSELLRRSLNGDRKLTATELIALCEELEMTLDDFKQAA